MSASSEARNLEVIVKAIEQHDRNCEYPAVAVAMNPYEVERLGWDTIKGLPIRTDPNLGTGRFDVICAGDENQHSEEQERRPWTPWPAARPRAAGRAAERQEAARVNPLSLDGIKGFTIWCRRGHYQRTRHQPPTRGAHRLRPRAARRSSRPPAPSPSSAPPPTASPRTSAPSASTSRTSSPSGGKAVALLIQRGRGDDDLWVERRLSAVFDADAEPVLHGSWVDGLDSASRS